MVDGKAVFSCITPVMLLQGRTITTLEGLGTVEAPGPMQRAFIAGAGGTVWVLHSGQMMRAQALLNRVPARNRSIDQGRAPASPVPVRNAYAYSACGPARGGGHEAEDCRSGGPNDDTCRLAAQRY